MYACCLSLIGLDRIGSELIKNTIFDTNMRQWIFMEFKFNPQLFDLKGDN